MRNVYNLPTSELNSDSQKKPFSRSNLGERKESVKMSQPIFRSPYANEYGLIYWYLYVCIFPILTLLKISSYITKWMEIEEQNECIEIIWILLMDGQVNYSSSASSYSAWIDFTLDF